MSFNDPFERRKSGDRFHFAFEVVKGFKMDSKVICGNSTSIVSDFDDKAIGDLFGFHMDRTM